MTIIFRPPTGQITDWLALDERLAADEQAQLEAGRTFDPTAQAVAGALHGYIRDLRHDLTDRMAAEEFEASERANEERADVR